MSDACFDGYHCHGSMVPVRLRDLLHPDAPVAVEDRVVAWLCACGVWRHATSPTREAELRASVVERMESRLSDLRHGLQQHEQRAFVKTVRTV